MPTSSPDPRLVDALAAGALRAHGVESLAPLVGLTAGEALERLKDHPHPDRDDGHLLAAIAERYRQRSLLARLWTRLRQTWCDHAAATSQRIAGATPPAYERRCGRCGATWSWREGR